MFTEHASEELADMFANPTEIRLLFEDGSDPATDPRIPEDQEMAVLYKHVVLQLLAAHMQNAPFEALSAILVTDEDGNRSGVMVQPDDLDEFHAHEIVPNPSEDDDAQD